MIDIHSHILPDLDDGPDTIDLAIAMLEVAEKQGIRQIIATPHHQNGKYFNNREKIVVAVNELNEFARKKGLNILVLPGQEVRLHGEIFHGMYEQTILTLNDTQKYMLIEFPDNHVPRYAERLFYDLQSEGVTPVIAHPERNSEIIKNPELLYNLVKKGALAQLTAASIVGDFGKNIKSFSEQLIENHLVHVIASDAHGIRTRGFKLAEAYDVVEKQFGSNTHYMFRENAEYLVKGKILHREVPERVKKKKKLFGIF